MIKESAVQRTRNKERNKYMNNKLGRRGKNMTIKLQTNKIID